MSRKPKARCKVLAPASESKLLSNGRNSSRDYDSDFDFDFEQSLRLRNSKVWPNYRWGEKQCGTEKSCGRYAYLPLASWPECTVMESVKICETILKLLISLKSSSQVANRISGKVFFSHYYLHFKCPTMRLRCKSIALPDASLSSISFARCCF